MKNYIRRALVLAAGVAFILAGPAVVRAYEFHLLGGMVVEGDLKDFRAGVFYINTEFGEMTINAANLDYIIVEPEDASGGEDAHEGVLEFGLPPGTKDWSPERVDAPDALEGNSLREAQLPETLRITADDFAGVMLDREDEAMPDPFEGHSLMENEEAVGSYPGRFMPEPGDGDAPEDE